MDTIKYHTWPETPYGKVTKLKKIHTRELKGQPFPNRWTQGWKQQFVWSVTKINPLKLNGIPLSYQLDQFITILRSGIFLFKF